MLVHNYRIQRGVRWNRVRIIPERRIVQLERIRGVRFVLQRRQCWDHLPLVRGIVRRSDTPSGAHHLEQPRSERIGSDVLGCARRYAQLIGDPEPLRDGGQPDALTDPALVMGE